MTRRLESRHFIGRTTELAELESALERAIRGEPSLALVGGEEGVGKSRLVRELSERAQDAGARVLIGGCAELGQSVPYLAVAEALGDLAPGADKRPPGPIAPERVYELFLGFLRELCNEQPVVLTVEDAHWADRSTLDLLAFLVRQARDERLLLIVTFRSDELGHREDLRAFLAQAARSPGTVRLELECFSREEADAQLEGILGAPADADLADAVFQRSEGNAFMAEELLATAPDERADRIPPTLRDAILARLVPLGPDAKRAVRVAAASGRRVHHGLLEAIAGLDPARLEEALREVVSHEVLVPDPDGGTFAFRHTLMHEVVAGELLPGERARLHAAFARALEAEPHLAGGGAAMAAGEIAHHWRQAGDARQALASAVRAGLAAERVHAPAEVQDHLERALALWGLVPDAEAVTGHDRVDLLARVAEAYAARGTLDHALASVDEALALARETWEPDAVALLHQRRSWYAWNAGDAAAALQSCQAAVELVPERPAELEWAEVLAAAGLVLTLIGHHDESTVCCQEALELARRHGARREEGLALAPLGMNLCAAGEVDAGIEAMRRAHAIARDSGGSWELGQVAINLSAELIRAGRYDEAVEVALGDAQPLRRAGFELSVGLFARLNAAEAHLHAGRWGEADALCSEVVRRRPTGVTGLRVKVLLAELAIRRGERDEARRHLAAARGIGSGPIGEGFDSIVERLEAHLAVWEGRPADAAARVEEALAFIQRYDDPIYVLRLAAVGARAEADLAERARAAREGARKVREAIGGAARLRETARRRAAGRSPPGTEEAALLATIDAEQARAEGAHRPALWATAVEAWEAHGHVPWIAYARWRAAEALVGARAPRAEVARALASARELAARLGTAPVEQEVDLLARRARIEFPAPEAAGPAPGPVLPAGVERLGLTAREIDVLQLLAAGRTNRQIAAELYISARTAGVHVSSILRKLSVSTRGEAAAAAHRLGLVDPSAVRGGTLRS